MAFDWINKFNKKKETENPNQDDLFVFALAVYHEDIYVYNMPVYKKTQYIDVQLKNAVFEFIKIMKTCSLDAIVDTLKLDQVIIYSLIQVLKDEYKILEKEKNVFSDISSQNQTQATTFQSENIDGLKIRFRTIISYIPLLKFMFEYQPTIKKNDFIDIKKNESLKKEYDLLFKNKNKNELYEKGFPQKYELDSDIYHQKSINIIDIINQSQKNSSKNQNNSNHLSHLNQNQNNYQDTICALLKRDIYILVYSCKNSSTSLKSIKIFITFSQKDIGYETIDIENEIIKSGENENIQDYSAMILFNQILNIFDLKNKELILNILTQDKEKKLDTQIELNKISINQKSILYIQK